MSYRPDYGREGFIVLKQKINVLCRGGEVINRKNVISHEESLVVKWE